MNLIYALAFGFTCLFVQKEPVLVTESFKLVNDLNKAENKPAIYMCRDVNGFWNDYLTGPKTDSEFQKRNFQKRLDSISKYIGGNLATWKKSLLRIESWQPRIKATEFVNYNDLGSGEFYKKHNQAVVFLYSQPLFNADRTKALVYLWYLTGRTTMLDNYYYCEKENGVWKKKNLVLIGGFNN